jgi:hypothetical protein
VVRHTRSYDPRYPRHATADPNTFTASINELCPHLLQADRAGADATDDRTLGRSAEVLEQCEKLLDSQPGAADEGAECTDGQFLVLGD